MKFSPCIAGQCTDQGSQCEGCGRTHEEIAETKKMIKALVSYAQMKGYENHQDYAHFIGNTVLNKLQNPS